jgi:transcriptional repressor OPI1
MDGYRTSRSESISSAASSAPASVDSPQLEQQQQQQRPHASGSSFPNDDSDGMSEEVRVAIAALGIMKRGGSATGVAGPSTSDTGARAGAGAGAAGGGPSGSRSASSTSNASYSWSASGPTDSTAASSPLAPASVVATEREGGDWDEPPPAGHHQQQHEATDPRFIERVSQLPIVSGGLEWYGHAKASSRVVKVNPFASSASRRRRMRPLISKSLNVLTST